MQPNHGGVAASHSDRHRGLQTKQKPTRDGVKTRDKNPLCAADDAGETASAPVQMVRRAVVGKHAPAREREAPSDWLCSSHEVPAMTSAAPSHWKSVTSRVRCRPPHALLISRCCINCMGLLGTSIIYVNYTDGLLYLATMYAWFFSVTCNMVEFFSYIKKNILIYLICLWHTLLFK